MAVGANAANLGPRSDWCLLKEADPQSASMTSAIGADRNLIAEAGELKALPRPRLIADGSRATHREA